MPVSPEKRAANRRNALKSTGPKSPLGRKISAGNAIRHGLSVPLPQNLADPLIRELALLISADGIAPETADDLAQKILEYERNLSYLKELFARGEEPDSWRYFKRSSNQLIKALRRL